MSPLLESLVDNTVAESDTKFANAVPFRTPGESFQWFFNSMDRVDPQYSQLSRKCSFRWQNPKSNACLRRVTYDVFNIRSRWQYWGGSENWAFFLALSSTRACTRFKTQKCSSFTRPFAGRSQQQGPCAVCFLKSVTAIYWTFLENGGFTWTSGLLTLFTATTFRHIFRFRSGRWEVKLPREDISIQFETIMFPTFHLLTSCLTKFWARVVVGLLL